jgi:hypothetical protein
MGFVLTTGSIITCSHRGTVAKVSKAKLKVGTNAVLLTSSVNNQTIDCPNQSNSTVKDKTVISVEGEATKLKVGEGKDGVLLADTFGGMGDGNPQGTLSAKANQTKLKAV